MMGKTKLSTIREQIAAAISKNGSDAIEWLEREISRLEKSPNDDQGELRVLMLVRDGLARGNRGKSQRTRRKTRAKTSKSR